MCGIFLISLATLLLEIAFSRLFSAIFFYHLSFLIISTALFGFGVSGVFLSLFPSPRHSAWRRSAAASLLFTIAVPVTLKTTLVLPFDINHQMTSLSDASYLALRYLFLALPFLFSGLVIGILLSSFPENIPRLYFLDLSGAAIGCLFPVFLVPQLGAQGTILFASVLGAMAALYFARKEKSRRLQSFSVLFFVVSLLLVYNADPYFAIPVREIMATKHPGLYKQTRGKIEFSGWSPLSRIDVLQLPGRKILFIDCGSNVSFLIPFDGNLERLQPRHNWRSLPYHLVQNPKVLIIGPSGGEDVLTALSWKASFITGVELDPLINRLVSGPYADYIGRIYNAPNVKLITDEGRSFIRRSREKFDVIQQIHNISPVAFASGAINLSESYLLTEESLGEYLDHLTDNGFLSIHRWGVIRMVSVAASVLEKRGISNPGRHIAVLERARERGVTNGFLLKKSPLTQTEMQIIRQFAAQNGYEVAYLPDIQHVDTPYTQLIRSRASREKFVRETGLNLFPPTDNQPFFDHFLPLGKTHFDAKKLGRDIARTIPFLTSGDMVLLGVLAESSVFGVVLLVVPLIVFARRGLRSRRVGLFIFYFFCLGIGFILIEIALIEKFILFLGNPTYSLAVVLFTILASAGAGSFYSRILAKRFGLRKAITGACLAAILFLFLIYTGLGPVVRWFLGVAPIWKGVLSILLIGPVAFFLGMPFPLGLTVLEQNNSYLIPWAWGMNGYATVLGSALCVVIAISFGFRVVVGIAAFIYLFALLSMRFAVK